MELAGGNILVSLLVILVVVGGGIALQLYLSGTESRWPGLILPAVWFLYTLLIVLGFAAYDGGSRWEMVWLLLVVGLRVNIPTFVLLVIYAIRRSTRRKKRDGGEIDKMKIQDL